MLYDKLQAYIASIYKKGDPKLQSNYRPISLLSSIYKFHVALIHKRLVDAMDNDITTRQYGFRMRCNTVGPYGHGFPSQSSQAETSGSVD